MARDSPHLRTPPAALYVYFIFIVVSCLTYTCSQLHSRAAGALRTHHTLSPVNEVVVWKSVLLLVITSSSTAAQLVGTARASTALFGALRRCELEIDKK